MTGRSTPGRLMIGRSPPGLVPGRLGRSTLPGPPVMGGTLGGVGRCGRSRPISTPEPGRVVPGKVVGPPAPGRVMPPVPGRVIPPVPGRVVGPPAPGRLLPPKPGFVMLGLAHGFFGPVGPVTPGRVVTGCCPLGRFGSVPVLPGNVGRVIAPGVIPPAGRFTLGSVVGRLICEGIDGMVAGRC